MIRVLFFVFVMVSLTSCHKSKSYVVSLTDSGQELLSEEVSNKLGIHVSWSENAPGIIQGSFSTPLDESEYMVTIETSQNTSYEFFTSLTGNYVQVYSLGYVDTLGERDFISGGLINTKLKIERVR